MIHGNPRYLTARIRHGQQAVDEKAKQKACGKAPVGWMPYGGAISIKQTYRPLMSRTAACTSANASLEVRVSWILSILSWLLGLKE